MLNDHEDDYTYSELVEALIAAGNPYAGRNSKLDRSLRARRQLRDRKGRWIYMGGGLGFTVRMPDGTLYRVLGRSVGASRREGFVQVYIPDGTAEGLPGGFYDVPATGSDVVQAILPGQEGAGKYTGSPTAAEIVNLGDLQVKDAPDGWRKNRDGSFTSEGSEFTVTAPAQDGSVKLQRDGRTVATLRDPATAIARAAKIDIQDTADPETKQVVARLKKDVTAARRALRDSTDEQTAAEAKKALEDSEAKVDRALFNDPDIVGEQDFEAERRAKEIAGLQSQDEELAAESEDIASQLEGMNSRTAEAQKLKARQREIAEERADIVDAINQIEADTAGEVEPEGMTDGAEDEDAGDWFVDPATGEVIENEPDTTPVDGGVYFLDDERVQEADIEGWLDKSPEYSQIFIQGTNDQGESELYKFIKSPSGDWIEFSFTSETIPIRTSKELADFMRRQRANGGLVASDESVINGGDLPTVEDALDNLRREASGQRERRPGDFQRARERARRVLDGDSGVEFEDDFDPANQEVISFNREDGPPREFWAEKDMWANYLHKNDWVEGLDGKWRKVVSKETFTEMRPSTDPNKGPYSFRRHTLTFDDGTTYEIETKNGWPDADEKKNRFNVVRETKDRRFEALDQQEQTEAPATPEPVQETEAPEGQPTPEPAPEPAPIPEPEPEVADEPALELLRAAGVPDKPGTKPIPEGAVRLFHFTKPDAVDSIKKNGLTPQEEGPSARAQEPAMIWAKQDSPAGGDDQYDLKPVVEFYLPEEEWNSGPLARNAVSGPVPTENILDVHEPWHRPARELAKRYTKEQVAAGELDQFRGMNPVWDQAMDNLKAAALGDEATTPEPTPETDAAPAPEPAADVDTATAEVDTATERLDDAEDQFEQATDEEQASAILDTVIDEVEKSDAAQTAAEKAIASSNEDEVAALSRHIDRLERAIARAVDRDQDISELQAQQDALIEQRDRLERGETDGRGDFDGGGQEELSLPESGPNSSRVKLERRGDQLRDLDGNVVARLTPAVSNADQRRERGEVVLDMFEVEKGYEGIFVDAISEAKAANKKYGSSVDVHDEEYYANARVFISEDGLVGAALNAGEEIVSVFRHPNAAQGVAGPLLGKLVELGGRRLDAMDTILPFIYAREGFKPVGRIDWNEDFKPADWDKKVYAKYKNGQPDVVFMVFDPERVGSQYDNEEGDRYGDYGQAMDVAIKMVEDTRAQNQNFVYNDVEEADELRIPEDAADFQTGPTPLDSSGRPSVAALRASKVGQIVEFTFANGRKGRFIKMSRDIWRRADNPNDTRKYFSSFFRSDNGLTFAEPTEADIPSFEPTPARKFARIDPRPYAVPRDLSPEEYQVLRNVYADQVENGTTERDRMRAEETVYLIDRIIARNEGNPLPRRADRLTRAIQRRRREMGETPTAAPERPATEAPEAPAAPETPEAEAPEAPAAAPERKVYDLRTDNPEGVFLDPAPYAPQGTGVDGTTDNPRELIDLFDQKELTNAFLKALRDQEPTINMEFPNGNTALVPTEAVRDALQLLGVDTTSLTAEYMRDIEEILDDNRPVARQQPFDNTIRITPEEQLANLFATRRAWQEELARFIAANPKAPADQINWRMDRITQLNGRIGRLQAAGIKMPYEVENIDLRNRMKMDGPDTYRPEFVWQAVKDAYPDAVELNDRELLLAQNTVTDANGNQFTYSAIITKTDDEQFYTYIREENHSEPDPAKKFRSMRVTSFRHSATAVLGRGGSKKDGSDYAISKVLETGAQDKINSWFNARARRANGMYITQDTVDAQGNPVHTRQQIITRDALTRIMEATDSDTVSEEMVYALYNYINEYGSGPAVLNELVKAYNIDENVVFRFVDAINANLGNRDHLDKFVLWESNTGIPLFENDRVTYVGTKNQRGHENWYGKTGRVQIRQLIHTSTQRGVPYTYTDYVYVQFEDADGNPEGEYTIVAAKNLRIDRTSGGTDGSERVGPNAISIPRPVLTARALNRHSARQTIADVLPFTAEYDRSIPSSPTVEINGQQYGVQVSRISTIGEHLQQRTVMAEDMEVGDFYFTYDEETGTQRLAEVIGIDMQSDGTFLVTSAIPIDLGSAKVNQTSYSAGFDMPFEIYREVTPMRPMGAPGEDEPDAPITPNHRDRLREALARADKRNIETAILNKAYRTIDNSNGGAANMREFEDILREVLAAMPENGAQPERRLSVPEAAKVIHNSLEVGTPNPEAERWVRQVVDAGLIKEDELRNDPDVPEEAVAPAPTVTVPDTTAVPGPTTTTTRVNAPAAPTTPGIPVTRQWFWDAEPGSLVFFPNMYGDGDGQVLRKQLDGTWVAEDGYAIYDRTTDIVSDFARNPDMATAYDVTQSVPSSDASISGLVVGDTPNEDWFLQANVGSKIRRSTVGDASAFVDVEKIDTDKWRDTMGRIYSTRQIVDTFYYDERNPVRRIETKIQVAAKPRDTRPSDDRLGDVVDEAWINGAGAGEYVEVTLPDGKKIVYLSRKLALGDPGRDIIWTPVLGLSDSAINSLDTAEFVAKYVNDESTPVNILGRRFYSWTDVGRGDITPEEVEWYVNAPSSTAINFPFTIPGRNGEETITVNARKTPSGDWGVVNVVGQTQFSRLVSSQELVTMFPDEGATRGSVDFIALPSGQRPQLDEDFPLDDKPYGEIATGPYSVEDAIPNISPDEFREAMEAGDERAIAEVMGQMFANRRFGNEFRLADLSLSVSLGSINLRSKIKDSQGNVVGDVVRDYEIEADGKFTVNHTKIWINESAKKRTGFSSEFKKFSTDFYRYLGVDLVTIGTVDDGSLVWAGMGYTWNNQGETGTIIYRLQNMITEAKNSGRDEDLKVLLDLERRFQLDFNHEDYPDPMDMAFLQYADPSAHNNSLAHDLLHGSRWGGIMYLNPLFDPRPESRRNKKREDFKDGKYKGFTDAEGNESDDVSGRYVDEDGNITDAFMWLDTAEDGTFVAATDNYDEPSLFVRENGIWYRATFGGAADDVSDRETVSETQLARYIGENGARVPDEDESAFYQDYFDGSVETDYIDQEALVEAFRQGDLVVIESVLRNELFGGGDAQYGELTIEGLNFQLRKATTDGVPTSYVHVGGQLVYEGDVVGDLARTFTVGPDGKLSVMHKNLTITRMGVRGRGKGFGTEFTQASEDFYERMDVQFANLEAWYNGGWYWADKGYGWDIRHYDEANGLESFMGRIPSNLENALVSATNEGRVEDAAQIREILSRLKRFKPGQPGFPTPQEIRQLKDSKTIMEDSRWRGIKYFGSARPDKEKLREEAGAPELDGWEFVDVQTSETSAELAAANVDAAAEAYLGLYGESPDELKLNNFRSMQNSIIDDYFVYQRGNVLLYVSKDEATGSSEKVQRVLDLQRKLIDSLPLQQDRPLRFRITKNQTRTALGTASPSYAQILYTPGGASAVTLYTENIANMPGTDESIFNFTRAGNPAFGNLAVGTLAHEWGHLLDYDSSGMSSLDDDESNYISLEFERRMKAFDAERGTNFWGTISGYVNSPGVSRKGKQKGKPASRVLEAWAESFAQFVAEEYFGDTSDTVIARIVRDLLRERGYLQ